MLSNSNVFILLILIKHSALFETTSANLVAVNARVDINDTKSNTVEMVTTPLSHVDHHFIGDSIRRGTLTATTEHNRPLTGEIKATTITATTTTTKGPLVAGSSKQAPFRSTTDREDNGAAASATTADDDDDDDNDNDDDLVSIHSTKTIAIPTQSTIDHAIKSSEEIPSNQQKQQQSTDNLKSAQNVSSKLEIVSSTLTNVIAKKTNHNLQTKPQPSPPPPPPPSISNKHSNHELNLEKKSSQNHSAHVENSWLVSKSANNNGNSNNQVIEDNDNIKKSVDYVNGRNDDDDSNDYVNPDIQLLPQSDAPSISSSTTMDRATDPQLDLMKPRPDAVYFIVAVIGGAKIWARTLARTLHEMGPPFSGDPLGSPLRPIYVDLPTNGR